MPGQPSPQGMMPPMGAPGPGKMAGPGGMSGRGPGMFPGAMGDEEMMKLAREPSNKKSTKKIREAEIVKVKPSKNKKSITKAPEPSGGATVVRRIKAK